MKTLVSFLACTFFLASSTLGQPQMLRVKAGVAKIKITPEQPVRMAGYGNRTEPFKDVHDDLFAHALVFDDGRSKACIITSDLIGFSHEFCTQVRRQIQNSLGIPEDNILVTAVHNHGGPTTRAYGGESTQNEKAYLATLEVKLVEVTKAALEDVEPVKLGAGIGTCRMNINRRGRHAEGGIWLGRNPDGPCDTDVTVLKIENTSSKLKGLLVNWPCHAVVGGQDNYSITGDWPGAATRELEKATSNATILMTAGASGDINPIYGPNNQFRDIEAVGQELAQEVSRVAESIDTYSLSGIEIQHHHVQVPGKKPSDSRMPNVSLEPGPEVEIRMSSLRVGNILFAGISGELMTEIGMQIKQDSPYKTTFVLTHCNGNSGYLVTDEAYKEGGYEPMVSRTQPGTAKIIREAFKEMNNGI